MKSNKKPMGKVFPLRLSDEMVERIKKCAEETGESEATIMRLMIRAGIKELERRDYDLFSFSSQEQKLPVSYNVSRTEDVALLRETSSKEKA